MSHGFRIRNQFLILFPPSTTIAKQGMGAGRPDFSRFAAGGRRGRALGPRPRLVCKFFLKNGTVALSLLFGN
jgi:hypothetical protein